MIIKKTAQDFIVDEILDESLLFENGAYHVYKLSKKNYTTERAVSHLAKALHIPRKNIGYAGTKDKQAVTTQYISIKGASRDHVEKIELQDISLEFIGYTKKQFYLGDLLGNRFTINVYGVDMVDVEHNFFVPNFFDDQRFSSHNVEIGLHILKKNFKDAVELVIASDKDFSSILHEYLASREGDYVGALRRLPQKTLSFYVHAVQSLLFNDSLSSFISQTVDSFDVDYSQGKLSFPKELKNGFSSETLPLAGFSEASDMMPKYGLSTSDFIIKQLPELTFEGSNRFMWSEVSNCSLVAIGAGVQVSFDLKKGSYATIVLRQLFKKNFAK